MQFSDDGHRVISAEDGSFTGILGIHRKNTIRNRRYILNRFGEYFADGYSLPDEFELVKGFMCQTLLEPDDEVDLDLIAGPYYTICKKDTKDAIKATFIEWID